MQRVSVQVSVQASCRCTRFREQPFSRSCLMESATAFQPNDIQPVPEGSHCEGGIQVFLDVYLPIVQPPADIILETTVIPR